MKGYNSNLEKILFSENLQSRYFLNMFKSKKKRANVRQGAIMPEEVKRRINEIGLHKKINILRIQYDGTPEEIPVTVKIVHIRNDYFTGKVVNVERSIKQDINDKLIYIKGGGGTVDFFFNDGDILSIEEDIDEVVIKKMDEEELLAILGALDLDEMVLLSYYDSNKGGVINGTGKLLMKDIEGRSFQVELILINDIELEKPILVNLNLDKDKVLDLEIVL